MTEKAKQIMLIAVMTALVFTLSVLCLFSPPKDYSLSERRSLAKPPELTANRVFSGLFSSDFETFVQDQFPWRENFRSLKSASALYLFGQKTVNDLCLAEGHIAKVEPYVKEHMISHATERFAFLQETYFPEKTPLFAVIPDKNFYLAAQNGYPAFDHKELINSLQTKLPQFSVEDLSGLLTRDDYYRTDTHWKQENITDVADFLAEKFGKTLPRDYTAIPMHVPFYGVYYGQLALPFAPDVVSYLRNETIDALSAASFDTGLPEAVPIYTFEKGEGKDGYELFLGGSHAILTIENPNAEGELVVFCDSFGQSLAPLLAQGFGKTTLVDIRYIQSGMVGNFVEFEHAEVLFLYSTTMLNNASAMK